MLAEIWLSVESALDILGLCCFCRLGLRFLNSLGLFRSEHNARVEKDNLAIFNLELGDGIYLADTHLIEAIQEYLTDPGHKGRIGDPLGMFSARRFDILGQPSRYRFLAHEQP